VSVCFALRCHRGSTFWRGLALQADGDLENGGREAGLAPSNPRRGSRRLVLCCVVAPAAGRWRPVGERTPLCGRRPGSLFGGSSSRASLVLLRPAFGSAQWVDGDARRTTLVPIEGCLAKDPARHAVRAPTQGGGEVSHSRARCGGLAAGTRARPTRERGLVVAAWVGGAVLALPTHGDSGRSTDLSLKAGSTVSVVDETHRVPAASGRSRAEARA